MDWRGWLRLGIAISVVIAILSMIIIGIWTRRKIKKIKSDYVYDKESRIKYHLVGKKPANSLIRSDIDFLIKLIDINKFKTLNKKSLIDDYSKTNIMNITKIKEVDNNYDLTIHLTKEVRNIKKILENTNRKGLIVCLVAPKRSKQAANMFRVLDRGNYSYEHLERGSGVFLIAKTKQTKRKNK